MQLHILLLFFQHYYLIKKIVDDKMIPQVPERKIRETKSLGLTTMSNIPIEIVHLKQRIALKMNL